MKNLVFRALRASGHAIFNKFLFLISNLSFSEFGLREPQPSTDLTNLYFLTVKKQYLNLPE